MTIKIIPIFKRAREIKQDGADIEEVLQCYSIEEIREQILGGNENENTNSNDRHTEQDTQGDERKSRKNGPRNNQEEPKEDNREPGDDQRRDRDDNDFSVRDSANTGYPFEILGIADDGRAYFLDYEKRMVSYDLDSLTQNKLISLGGLAHFSDDAGTPIKKDDWLAEIDGIMRRSKKADFNMDDVRGRGAWRDNKGNISYHDGQTTRGNYDQNWTFIRKPKKSIGLDSQECSADVRRSIMEIAKRFSFKTPADATRLLSWGALASFSGALLWRPAALVTGESGSGKSTVIENVILPLSLATFGDGGSSTEPGLRQFHRQDACGIVIDEAERKKKGAKERLDNIFTMMRTSTSDNSPSSFKGTAGGSAMVFKMRCMFCFVAIDATIEDTANDNRIIKIDFKKVNNYKSYIEDMKELRELLTVKNCDGIRAFTWNNLEKIIRLAKRLELIIQSQTGQDARYAAGESILLAANMIVWENMQALDNDTITEYVQGFYQNQTIEEKRDETDEMIQSLLDETIIFGSDKSTHSLRELLIVVKKYIDNKHYTNNGEHQKIDINVHNISDDYYRAAKRSVEQCGLTVHGPTRELAIAHPHNWIMNKLGLSRGYQRQLVRHKNIVEYKGTDFPTMTIDSGTKRAVIIGGALEYNQTEDNPDDQPF